MALLQRKARALNPAQTSASAGQAVDNQEVARVAYELYLQRGRVDGHDLEDWLEAERVVRQRNGRFSSKR